jgi:hypothetical protein
MQREFQSAEATPFTTVFQQASWRRRAAAAVVAACAVLGIWTYDALGYRQAERFEAAHADDPAVVLACWRDYQTWHPTRTWLRPGAAWAEAEHLRGLEEAARHQGARARLAELRRLADDADPAELWQRFQGACTDLAEGFTSADIEELRFQIKSRRDQHVNRRAQQALDDLTWAEQQAPHLAALVAQADQFLHDFAGTPQEGEVRRRRAAYVQRMEEREIEPARELSARTPLDFAGRREQYQRYLDRHPAGAFALEARTALRAIDIECDKHDFRVIRDQYIANPGSVTALVASCRAYRNTHPHGHFVAAVDELLRWTERVTAPGEYRVVLRSGRFEKGVARYLSRGPDLSVELEVGGVRYGPSSLSVNRYDPEWNHEFPRRVRWKLGEPVRIRVTDHDYSSRTVLDVSSQEGEALAMQLLTGEIWNGPNCLSFESDFRMPVLPRVE